MHQRYLGRRSNCLIEKLENLWQFSEPGGVLKTGYGSQNRGEF